MEFQLSYLKILKNEAVKVLHSICYQIWKTHQWPQCWKRSVFIPIQKKGNSKECSTYHAIALISLASKVMLKILQAKLHNTWIENFQMYKLVWRTRYKIANIQWTIGKSSEFQKNIYICFTNYAKAFHCVDHNKLLKILKRMEVPDHLTCLLKVCM